jgi:hypothetical protein
MHGPLLRFLPPGVRPEERDDLHRATLTIAGCFIAGALGFTIAITQARWGILEAAWICAVLAGCSAALPFWVRRTGRWRVAAGVLTGLVWIASFAVAALTGGTLLTALFCLAFAAAVATLTLGPQAGAALTLANAFVVAALYALHVEDVIPARSVPADVTLASGMRGALVFNLALAALVTAYEWMRAATLRQSEKNERRFRAMADYGPDLIAEVDAAGRIAHVASGGDALNAQIGQRVGLHLLHADDRAAAADGVRLLETQASVRVGPAGCRPRGIRVGSRRPSRASATAGSGAFWWWRAR